MSLDIQGYMLPGMKLNEMNEFAKDFRRKVRKAARELVAAEIANLAVKFHDYFRYDSKRQALLKPILSDKFLKFDFGCDLALFPVTIAGEDCILAMLLTKQEKFKEIFENYPFVQDFSYREGDKPDHISEEEWAMIKNIWREALSETGIPSCKGIVISCLKNVPFIPVKELLPYVEKISHFVRAKLVAELVLIARKYNELKEYFPEKQVMTRVLAYMKTEPGEEELKKEIEAICRLLPEKVQAVDLVQASK